MSCDPSSLRAGQRSTEGSPGRLYELVESHSIDFLILSPSGQIADAFDVWRVGEAASSVKSVALQTIMAKLYQNEELALRLEFLLFRPC